MNTTETIFKYGKEILASDIFQKAYHQKHHFSSTVADHSIDVARVSLDIAKAMQKSGIPVNTEMLVKCALCHDLGILGRFDEKFKSGPDCCKRHPIESVDEAEKLLGNLSEAYRHAISRHMWPLTPVPPDSTEGLILTIADKVCCVQESLGIGMNHIWQIRNYMLLCETGCA